MFFKRCWNNSLGIILVLFSHFLDASRTQRCVEQGYFCRLCCMCPKHPQHQPLRHHPHSFAKAPARQRRGETRSTGRLWFPPLGHCKKETVALLLPGRMRSAKQTKKNPRQWEGLEGASKARCTAPKSFHPSKPIVIGTWETRGQTDRKPVAPVENCCIYTLEAIKSSVYRPTEGCFYLLSLLYLFRQSTGWELDGSGTRRKYLQTGPSTTA